MTALLLLAVGVRDLAGVVPGPWSRRLWGPLLAAAAAVLVAGSLLVLTGRALPALAPGLIAALGAATLWHALAAARPALRLAGAAGVVVLAVAEATAARPWTDVPVGLTLLAGALVLVETANVLSRDVLLLSGRPSTDRAPAPGHASGGLRGGRFIGPMERLLMTVLGLVGAWQVVAAIMAAKGIVRFPEISFDARAHDPKGGPPGASAEEFLIGSFASWSVAAGVGLVVHRAVTGG